MFSRKLCVGNSGIQPQSAEPRSWRIKFDDNRQMIPLLLVF